MRLRRFRIQAAIAVLALAVATPAAAGAERAARKRAAIDAMATQTMKRLLLESEHARELADRVAGWAVFDTFEAAFLISGGGGVGVAVDERTGERTYMKMGTGGIGLGLGGQSSQIVFMFEDHDAFRRFVDRGWRADTSANAAAGNTGKNYASSFNEGVVMFQITNRGLLALANVSGAKYWKARKLNRR